MQLSGPPKINGWVAPMPVKDKPLEGEWGMDRDIATLRRDRTGAVELVGEAHYRGRWRVAWDGLTPEQAARIIYETGAKDVTGGSDDTFLWTPRTRQSGDLEAIDINGDGVPDVVVEEVILECRLAAPQPSTSPLFRRVGGQRVDRVELEIETVDTFPERAGLGFPETFNLGVAGGTEFDADFRDGDGFHSPKVGQVIVFDSNTEVLKSVTYPGGLPVSLPSDAVSVSVVSTSDFEEIIEARIDGVIDLSTVTPVDFTDVTQFRVNRGSKGLFGTSTVDVCPPNATTLFFKSSREGEVYISHQGDDVTDLYYYGVEIVDDVTNLDNNEETIFLRSSTFVNGTPHPTSSDLSSSLSYWNSVGVEVNGKARLELDLQEFQKASSQIEYIGAGRRAFNGDRRSFMLNERNLVEFPLVTDSNRPIGDQESSGGDLHQNGVSTTIMPPTLEHHVMRKAEIYWYDDFTNVDGREVFLGLVNGKCININSSIDALDSDIANGVDASGLTTIFQKGFGSMKGGIRFPMLKNKWDILTTLDANGDIQNKKLKSRTPPIRVNDYNLDGSTVVFGSISSSQAEVIFYDPDGFIADSYNTDYENSPDGSGVGLTDEDIVSNGGNNQPSSYGGFAMSEQPVKSDSNLNADEVAILIDDSDPDATVRDAGDVNEPANNGFISNSDPTGWVIE